MVKKDLLELTSRPKRAKLLCEKILNYDGETDFKDIAPSRANAYYVAEARDFTFVIEYYRLSKKEHQKWISSIGARERNA